MVWIRAKTLNLNLLLSAIFYSSLTSFCRAQGNPCETVGVCGPFGVCNQQGSPICSCLQGFYPRNNQEWSSSNWTSGCARRVPLDCEGNNRTTDGFLKLKMMKLSGYTGMWAGPENQCADRCLRNCSCVAYGYDFNVGCVYWNITLIGIQKFPSGSASDLNIRVSKSELDQKKGSKKIIIIVVVVGFVIISICAFLSWKWIGKNRGRRDTIQLGRVDSSGSVVTSVQDALNHVNLEDVQMFEFAILANATNDFSNANKLGKGGFGTVYKVASLAGLLIASALYFVYHT